MDGKLFCTNDGPDESRAWSFRLMAKEEEKYRKKSIFSMGDFTENILWEM